MEFQFIDPVIAKNIEAAGVKATLERYIKMRDVLHVTIETTNTDHASVLSDVEFLMDQIIDKIKDYAVKHEIKY